MWKKVLLTMGLAVLIAAPVNAQSVSLGPQVGYYRVPDADKGELMFGIMTLKKFLAVMTWKATFMSSPQGYSLVCNHLQS